MLDDAFNRYCDTLPPGSPELQYYCAIGSLVSSIEFDPADPVVGLGLLEFLTIYDFVGAGIDTRSHPVSGSRLEDSLLVSKIFHPVGRDEHWWRRELLEKEGSADVVKQREWWRQQLELTPEMVRIIG